MKYKVGDRVQIDVWSTNGGWQDDATVVETYTGGKWPYHVVHCDSDGEQVRVSEDQSRAAHVVGLLTQPKEK